jgi:hypothetical protein
LLLNCFFEEAVVAALFFHSRGRERAVVLVGFLLRCGGFGGFFCLAISTAEVG